jgi:aminocarboxymuconate-semialdehyde decarboxylase
VQFEQRLDWLDGQGMAQQLVAPWLDVHGQQLPAAAGRDWVRILNDAMAEAVAPTGGRLLAHATLHLADPPVAAVELDRAVTALGMTGCMIPTDLPAGTLADPVFDAVWEVAEGLGVPVVLHPTTDSPTACLFDGQPKYKGLYGRTIDTTICATNLIVAGVFDRFPELRLVLVHGGGFLPYQTGRLDREFGGEGRLPSEAVKSFYYDTVFMSAPALRLLFELVGTGHVMIGSDYAAGPKERPGLALRAALDATGADDLVRRQVRRETAAQLFRTPEVAAA